MADSWGHGSTLGYSAVGLDTYTDIATVIEIESRKLKREPIKTTLLETQRATQLNGAVVAGSNVVLTLDETTGITHGTFLQIVDGGDTEVVQVVSMTGLTATVATLAHNHADNTVVNIRCWRNTHTHRAGMVMPDPVKLKIQYHKTLHATLLDLVDDDSPNRDWKITLSDGAEDVFTGFISEFDESPKASNDSVYENEITIQPTGAGTYTGTP